MNLSTAWNAEFIEEQYQRWKADPGSVSSDWRFFGASAGLPGPPGGMPHRASPAGTGSL
ncbi:MAG: hypothetical protein P8X80_13955 [Desulfobacterales bacterium]